MITPRSNIAALTPYSSARRSETAQGLWLNANEAGETWTLDIYDSRTSGGWAWFSVDTVSIPGVIPKPSTFALATLGVLGLCSRRRKA